MAKVVYRAKMCYLCGGIEGNSGNIDAHCHQFHTFLPDCEGAQPSGYVWRVMNEHYPHLLVAYKAEHPGKNKKNVMYCFDCHRMYVGPDNITDPTRIFERHCKSALTQQYRCVPQGTGSPSKKKGLILGPRNKEGMATSTVAVRKDGIWLDESVYMSLRAKYPAVACADPFKDGREDQVFDPMKLLDYMGVAVTEQEKREKASREARTAPLAKKAEVTGDYWKAAACEILEDEDLSDQFELLYESEKNQYAVEYAEYKGEDDSDEEDDDEDTIQHVIDDEPKIEPDSNIYRRALKTALLHSTKVTKIPQMVKVAAAKEVAKKDKEIEDLKEEIRLLRQQVQLKNLTLSQVPVALAPQPVPTDLSGNDGSHASHPLHEFPPQSDVASPQCDEDE